jgi:hypothetical protein
MAHFDEKADEREGTRQPNSEQAKPPLAQPHTVSNELRRPMPTLPDGVPAELWEEAVESERFLAE